jgi:trigger factor
LGTPIRIIKSPNPQITESPIQQINKQNMVARKDIDSTSAIITVTVTRDELKPKIESELKKFRTRAPIKGFRAGQAPMDFVKKLYGPSVFSDALNDMLSRELMNYLRESKLDVLGQPLPTEDQRSFSFKINDLEPEYAVNYEVGFVPPFEIKGLGKNTIYERLTVSNLDELAEEDLQYARKRMGKRSNPETDIQDNDIVRIAARELESDADSNVKEGGWETTMTIFMKNVADEQLKTQLLFSKKGDTLRFNARSFENHEKEEMHRKYILNLEKDDDRAVGDWFEGAIEEVSRVEDADLDEDFFKGYFGEGRVGNKEEAVEELKKDIQQSYDLRSNALLMRSFQERLLAENPLEIPSNFLKRWLKVSNEGGLTDAQIELEFPAFAENLRWTLLKDKIKEASGVEVTDDDVYAEFAKRVRNYFQTDLPDNFVESSVDRLMKNEKDVEKTRRDLETDKIFVAIRDQVKVKDKAVSSEEFHKILEEVTKKAKAEQEIGVINDE